MNPREPAWRILAAELAATTVAEKGGTERGAAFLLSPLGARMHRVLMVGTLDLPRPLGRDPAQPFFGSRLSDPTGRVDVTAGSFQPRALRALQRWDAPTLALIVGKPQLLPGRNGPPHPTLRAEALRPIPPENYRLHLLDAIRQTDDRIDHFEALQAGRTGPDVRGKWPGAWEEPAREAARRYPGSQVAALREAARLALDSLERAVSAPLLPEASARPSSPARITYAPPPPAPATDRSPRPGESTFLEAVDELSESSLDGYADLKGVLARLAAEGVDTPRAEALLDHLEATGAVEEPIVGKLRRP